MGKRNPQYTRGFLYSYEIVSEHRPEAPRKRANVAERVKMGGLRQVYMLTACESRCRLVTDETIDVVVSVRLVVGVAL